ncbi:ThiF family adenylyltransferase [Alkaliphilus pronyensis]|uniref:ThiF family adenylyltransferase n=1 Tax=Alkaliphilus pronyensis TaxID=1482732 RepID=UPI00186573DD|nr:ThiF family adenylyltransferase [Alkaliphilus pronyensis]
MEERYIKQINFNGIGKAGQEKLNMGRVLIIGCGALGTVVANSLARTGVGFIRIVDRDYVEVSNLHRQILFDELDAEKSVPKVEAAKAKLKKVNSLIEVEAIIKDVNSITIEKMVENIHIIIDCTDNFKTRFLINDISFKSKIPWIYGGAIGSTGVVKSFIPGKTGCFRCMLEAPPPAGTFPTCDTAGVINTTTGMVGMLQANEAIKYLAGKENEMDNKMVYFDLWENTFERIELREKKACKCCKSNMYQYLDDKEPQVLHMCGNNSLQVDPHGGKGKISLKELHKRLSSAGIMVKLTPFLLNIEVEGYEIKVFDDGRAIIKNASTTEEAMGVYSRYIGY